MALKDVQAVILAAGKSSRFKTGKTKLVEKLCGQEMILYPTKLFTSLNVPVSMVVGFQKELIQDTVEKHFKDAVLFVEQTEQRGTGDAIKTSQPTWTKDHILVMNGDMPLVTTDIVEDLYAKHKQEDAAISFVTAHNCEPTAGHYGRVVQEESAIEIVEAKEFKGDIGENCCINAGVYLIKRTFLEESMQKLTQSSVTSEWYITDLVKIASDQKLGVSTISAPFDKIRGINTFKELWAAEQILKAEIVKYWMDNGVRFSIAHNVQIDRRVNIGAGSSIESAAQLLGSTTIGKNCSIGAFSIIKNSSIADNTIIHSHTVVSDTTIGSEVQVGPFAHVWEDSVIQDNTTIGNFVEVKRSTIGSGTKAKHLTYLGDAVIGNRVNIGAGTITCNYDGTEKHKTRIEDDVFVGSNNTLVAPVTIKKKAFTAAGSTITTEVPEGALAIARERQVNKDGYASKIKNKKTTTAQLEDSSPFLAAIKDKSFENNQ
ncbi:MAG: bifunctional UDP-N-acetylglucosamine pyrophosphorylase/glucosamine-1-phosphate N-acetyltransferase [Alteromonas naphthalenivorans]|jgi:bifunctional UDP-N-acetylglucosamine pyrophosphorylase/glucosamine-1-phosphate N-acetyltransferase